MGKKRSGRVMAGASADNEILDFLFSLNKPVDTTTIAKNTGFSKAIDVTSRLNKLCKQGAFEKSHLNNRVFWSMNKNRDDHCEKNPVDGDQSLIEVNAGLKKLRLTFQITL